MHMSRIGVEAFNIKKQNTGIGYYTKSLVEELNKLENENEYYTYINEDIKQSLSISNLKSYEVSSKAKEAIYRHFMMGNIAKKDKLDLYHGTSFYIPKGIKCKSVVTVHDLSFLKYPETFTKSRILYGKMFIKDSVNRANKVIAVSKSTKNDIVNYYGIDESKVEVVYLGARDIFSEANQEEIINIKKKFSVDRYILSVGTLEPRKNLSSLLKAFNRISDKIDKDIKIVFVGKKGWLIGDLLEEARKISDRIVFTGYVTDEELKCLYSGAQLFAYPSIYEGFGLPVLEAMSCGANILTSNVSSLPEVIGNVGELINPLDVNEIAEGILKCLEKDKDAMKQCVIKRSQKFSWNKCAEDTNRLYENLLEK